MTKSLNRVQVGTVTTGTGAMSLGSASGANVMTFAQAGGVDGDIVNYVIEDGADFEIGIGTLSSTAAVLSRDTVFISKASATIGTTKLALTGAARVRSAEPADLFNHMFYNGESIKTVDYVIVANDKNRALVANKATAITFTVTAAATLGDQFPVMVRNIGVGNLTIDPNGAETIDGAATLVLKTGQSVLLICNGTGFRTMFLAKSNLADMGDVDFVTVPPATGDGLVYDSVAGKWKPGAAGGGMFRGNNGTVGSRSGDIFRVNAQTLTVDVTIGATENASAAGPLIINTGVTLTVTTGGTLVIL